MAESLLWSTQQTRKHFSEKKYWPQFIGLKHDEKDSKSLLPVLVWEEQRSHELFSLKKNKKRKRDVDSNPSTNDQNDAENQNHKRSKLSATIYDYIGSLGARIGSLFSNSMKTILRYPFYWTHDNETYDQGSKMKNENHLIQEEAPMSEAERNQDLHLNEPETLKQLSKSAYALSFPVSSLFFHKKSEFQIHRDLVFMTLQDLGFFIGPGDVYGGDYCIYCGDPTMTHSIATVRILPGPKVSSKELLAFSRVQNQVEFLISYTHNQPLLSTWEASKGVWVHDPCLYPSINRRIVYLRVAKSCVFAYVKERPSEGPSNESSNESKRNFVVSFTLFNFQVVSDRS